jgi:hypothetical protein
MVNDSRSKLSGLVEVDETHIGGPAKGKRSRGVAASEHKTLVVGAVEVLVHHHQPLIRALVGVIGKRGSVVAYNKGFESGCLSALARAFPKYAKQLHGIAARLVDPLPIFRAHVYDREFRGSFSIKSVAPALLGDSLSYEGMTVADGTGAQIAFEELIADGTSAARKAGLRQAMLDYCRKDTIAMVNLVEWLRQAEDHE